MKEVISKSETRFGFPSPEELTEQRLEAREAMRKTVVFRWAKFAAAQQAVRRSAEADVRAGGAKNAAHAFWYQNEQHITTLLLTLLFRYMRPLIDLGYVYLAQPPLYRLKWSNSEHEYVYSDRERDALLKEGVASGKRIPKDNGVQRYKGLGEMNHQELWDTTMNPETRTLLQVTLEDAAVADGVFATLMGEDVEARRSFIQQNAKDVRFLDI